MSRPGSGSPARVVGAAAVRVVRTDALLASCVLTASSVWARFRGLMGRGALTPGEGLWLPGDTSIHMLFMRIPIDAVFLAQASPVAPDDDRDQGRQPGWRVVEIRPRLQPWTGVVWYVRDARGCLELEAGAAERAGLRVGDVVLFEPAPTTAAPDVP